MYICPFVSVPPLLFQYCNQPVIFAFVPLQAGKPRDRKSVQTCCQCYTGIKKWGCDANGERKTVNDAKIDFESTTFGDCLGQPRREQKKAILGQQAYRGIQRIVGEE